MIPRRLSNRLVRNFEGGDGVTFRAVVKQDWIMLGSSKEKTETNEPASAM